MSEKKNKGGSAFPYVSHNFESGFSVVDGGMTLRDYFAAHALIGIMTSQIERRLIGEENIAKVSFNIADAMIAERDK